VEATAVSASREAILGRIRSAVADAPESLGIARTYRRHGTLERAARLDLLSERIADYRADVHRVAAADLRTAIWDVFAKRAARRIGVARGVPPEWRPAELDLVEDGELSPRELDRLDGVLTGCTVAIAETGTIVLTAGPAEGTRALTLVPDLHVCVVGEEQVVELVPEAMAVLEDLVRRERRPITFISGPSATSDIELSRVEGVHGPRTLVVLIAQDR
jgi:L-lactate dehydrogenase complex protein LldG